ncbi:unnamed protein product [Cylindrotheca closterium]|uniref:Peptidase M11 gametolysin domain-containing protein n=1 Tax=Cylindrotheca closterium TaxID=2856 RepID=A0AAD2CDR2_9STRA|nr:unnamed protein product [Cylindrotheca closterium]
MFFNIKLGLLAAAVAAASADDGNLRKLHDVRSHETHDVRSHGKNGVNRVESKSRSGGTQTQPCVLVERVQETEEGAEKSWYCLLKGEDALEAGFSVAIEGIGFVNDAYDGKLCSGTIEMLATNAVINSSELTLTITADSEITFPPVQNRRKLKSSTGIQKALVVRVTTSDGKAPEPSAAQMSDKVFGTSGDIVNAKSVFEGCSHGKMKVVPATGDGVINGVIEITSSAVSIPKGDHAIYNDVLEKLETHFSVTDLASIFEFVLIGIPDGTMKGAWAYAQTPYSIYGDPNILYPTMTVHEMGHNLNLHHANEGTSKEGVNGDHQGMMGYVIDHDEGLAAKLCYNPAKNYYIGWYSDRLQDVKPQIAEYSGKLIGVGNYDKISGDDKIVLKLAGPPGDEDYYIGYNHASGWNEGTHESINEVTVVKQKPGFEISTKVASLKQGQEYKISNYLDLGKDVTIKVTQVDANTATGFAAVQICFGACGSSPATPAPVSTTPAPVSPTPAPVSPSGGCTDDANWKDTDDWGCAEYKSNAVCDPYGDWAVDGVSANNACCHCKGSGPSSTPAPVSTTPAPVSPSGGCTDDANWKDTDDWGCAEYKSNEMCDPNGDWAVNGVSADNACCHCK